MSIRNALMGLISGLLVVGFGVVASIGTFSIHRNVLHEVRSRVDHALSTLASLYRNDLDLTAEQFRFAIDHLELNTDPDGRAEQLLRARQQVGFSILNMCGPDGAPLAGSYGDWTSNVAVDRDPIIRAALRG